MKYSKFIIRNFKGIKELELDLDSMPSGKIFPLIGLNESGKTTILEAINFLQEDIEDDKEHYLIHKRDCGNFTGEIKTTAILILSETDKKSISMFLNDNRMMYENMFNQITITKYYKFENSEFKKSGRFWIFDKEFKVKKTSQRIYRKISDVDDEFWLDFVKHVDLLIPKILYFPDFLFEFPNCIYLKEVDNYPGGEKEKETQRRYRLILDDILHSIDSNYSVKDFLSKLESLNNPGKIEASTQIKQQISTKLNDKILAPWEELFSGTNKRILIETTNDENGYSLQLKIQEGSSSFTVNERSLGFRWFFGFILFTEFRKTRASENGQYLFLFDEPASNLHENSQNKLLRIFELLAKEAKIIYSTHSPYLLNSKYILNSFIVKDKGREVLDQNFKQNIKAIPYRQFVAKYPNEETHFKPILDVLEFKATDFDLTDEIVFFEGKFDYYTFKWFKDTILKNTDLKFKLYPGAGVDKYQNIFREYLAHNRRFIAVFDSDKQGKDAQKKYIKEISIELQSQIFTLEDINEAHVKFKTEELFSSDERLMIQKLSFPESVRYSKSKFNTAIQEMFINNNEVEISEETKTRFENVFAFITNKFSQLGD